MRRPKLRKHTSFTPNGPTAQLDDPIACVASRAPALSRHQRFRLKAALGNETPHAPPETPQTHLVHTQRPSRIARRPHSRLNSLDERLVLEVDASIDPPVQIASRSHLPPRIR